MTSPLRPEQTQSRTLPSLELGSDARDNASGADLEAPISQVRGASTERFTDLGEIGRGGMGSVHRMFDGVMQREVAVKWLDEAGQNAMRFLREAQITGQLSHPNIVPVYDIGFREDGAPAYYTMKFIHGKTLFELLAEPGGPLARLRRVVPILLKVCEAMHYAHQRGFIHCDLKPENVMVDELGQAYVMDWGVAMLSALGEAVGRGGPERGKLKTPPVEAGAPLGTLAYMSPEQAWGSLEQIGPQSDVFALGAILYHALAGEPPYHGEKPFDVLTRARAARPCLALIEGDTAPKELLNLIRRAMQLDPSQRHSNALEFREELNRFWSGSAGLLGARFEPGAWIAEPGERLKAAYWISDGECEVIHRVGARNRKLRRLGPGSVFGGFGAFEERSLALGLRALSRVTAYRISPEILAQAINEPFWLSFLSQVALEAEQYSRDLFEREASR